MTTRPEDQPDEPRLDSWKEIASYLGPGIRTVQRWEREEGLPVHRLDHAKRGSVYASRRELTAWWESRRRPEPARLDERRRIWRAARTSFGTRDRRIGGNILARVVVRRAHGRVRLRYGQERRIAAGMAAAGRRGGGAADRRPA